MRVPRMSRAEILRDLDASLRYLRTDAIDLYWLHRDDPNTSVEPIIDLLNEQKRAGKMRYFGCSNWRTARIEAAQDYAARSGQQGFVANQMLWNAAVIDLRGITDATLALMDQEMWQFHHATGLAALPYNSQANGLFTKMTRPPGRTFKRRSLVELRRAIIAAAKRALGVAPPRYLVHPRAANQTRFQCIKRIADENNLTVTQVVLGYLLSQPLITIPIIGSRTEAQLVGSLAGADVRLSPAQLAAIDWAGGTVSTPGG